MQNTPLSGLKSLMRLLSHADAHAGGAEIILAVCAAAIFRERILLKKVEKNVRIHGIMIIITDVR